MTLGDLIHEFRIRTQDTAKPYLFPDEEIIPWFNEAESEAAIRGKLLLDSMEFEVSPGVLEYYLPACLFDIQHAELRQNGKFIRVLDAMDRRQLDRDRHGWRTETEPPKAYIHDERQLCLTSLPDSSYTVFIEYLRTPVRRMTNESSLPEIRSHHHEKLIDWVMYMAYSKPDADTIDPGRAGKAEAEFTRYFGKHPGADLRRRQNSNRPHRNKCHW